tara:strand:+ start:877 stop:987 length:111 start_codon:yes stop_codon:yes gene_type:complete
MQLTKRKIAVRGNPLKNIAVMGDVKFAMKGGTVFRQ